MQAQNPSAAAITKNIHEQANSKTPPSRPVADPFRAEADAQAARYPPASNIEHYCPAMASAVFCTSDIGHQG